MLAIGRLQVLVYQDLIVFVASEAYHPPWDYPDLRSSLTNTSLQPEEMRETSRLNFWSSFANELLSADQKEGVFQQVCEISAEIFRAASEIAIGGFVLLPGCFELFALDFLIDKEGAVWLLEVNGGPAIPQEGVGGSLMTGLFESITCITVRKLTGSKERYPAEERLIEVLDCKLSPSSIKEIVY